jgi:UPF0755 protein
VTKKRLLVFTLFTLIAFLSYMGLFFVPVKLKSPVILEVKKGAVFKEVIRDLSDAGLIHDARLVTFIASLTGADRKIKHGFYEFRDSITPYRVLRRLLEGDVMTKEVTIPEGFNLWQVASRLQEAGLCDRESFLKAARDERLLDRLGIDSLSVEGYLYPDTYRFPLGVEPEEIITTMVKNLRSHFTPDMIERMRELGMTEREVLTLASLIEKEAKVDDERPLISAVFHNRLKKGIPLESDPTAVYGIKDLSEGVTKEDLKRLTPYNTYIIKGLPPTPIASAGISSIIAALYPADVPYMFFVSMNNGRHYFSTTMSEHLKAIKRFRNH